MGSGFGTIWANRLADTLIGDAPVFTRPSTVYLALYNAPGVEVSGAGYARIGISNTSAEWTAAGAGKKRNVNLIVFPSAGIGGWGLVDGLGVLDAATDGNLMFFGGFTAIAVTDGDALFFDPGTIQLVLQLAPGIE